MIKLMLRSRNHRYKRWVTLAALAVIILIFGAAIVRQAGWLAGKPNTCPMLQPPVNVAQVTSVLYPGQFRGGQFKAHGGFRLDTSSNDQVTVRAPLNATLVDAARYIEQGEVQYILDFQAACGLSYRFDHLLTLAPAIAAATNQLPPAQVGSPQTHSVAATPVRVGDAIAAAVGFRNSGVGGHNTAFDFGVYDRGVKNSLPETPAFLRSINDPDPWQAEHGLCWLNLLPSSVAAQLKALPAGDFHSGKTSYYCHN